MRVETATFVLDPSDRVELREATGASLPGWYALAISPADALNGTFASIYMTKEALEMLREALRSRVEASAA